MSMIAVGAYVRYLRESYDLTSLTVSTLAHVNPNYIWRIETGEIKPGAEKLAAVIRAVKGNFEEVSQLLLDENATEEDGRIVAERRFQAGASDVDYHPPDVEPEQPQPYVRKRMFADEDRAVRNFVKSLSSAQRVHLRTLLRQVEENPHYFLYYFGLLEGLDQEPGHMHHASAPEDNILAPQHETPAPPVDPETPD